MVLDETTEMGRFFHIGIVLGKKNFSGRHYKQVCLSAFRPGYGTQSILLKIIEDWKKALDENNFFFVLFLLIFQKLSPT